MKKQTEAIPTGACVLDRWTVRSDAATKEARQGKPEGELSRLVVMDSSYSRIPNTLYEDATGQLWLAFSVNLELDAEGGFEAVNGETALGWLRYVSEFAEGIEADFADVCRIALAELARRPTDLERVRRAIMEERQAGFKPRRAGKEKRS